MKAERDCWVIEKASDHQIGLSYRKKGHGIPSGNLAVRGLSTISCEILCEERSNIVAEVWRKDLRRTELLQLTSPDLY